MLSIPNSILSSVRMLCWYIYKESAEQTFVYQVGGCGKTCNNNKRCDTPHLNSMRRVRRMRTAAQLYKEECCSPSRCYRKLPHFLLRTIRKHFHKKCSTLHLYQAQGNTKLKNVFHLNNTWQGIATKNQLKIVSLINLIELLILLDVNF